MGGQRLDARERASRALHAPVAERLRQNPQAVIAHARANLARWRRDAYPDPPLWMREWECILDAGPGRVLAVLEGTDEHAIWLRTSSPFAGLLSPRERWRILREQHRARLASDP